MLAMFDHLPTIIAALDVALILVTIPWILSIKEDSNAAIAWSLVVILLPLLGSALFVVFGYTYVHRPLKRKRRHRIHIERRSPDAGRSTAALHEPAADAGWQGLGGLAERLGAFPTSSGNQVALYHETTDAMQAVFDAIEQARDHIHAEFYIVQPDDTGRRFINALARRAGDGVEVRLLYDALGSLWLKRSLLRPLERAGCRHASFLGINPLRRRVQVNLRNHRKLLIVDGRTALTGGMNIGDEYLHRNKKLGYWRDTHMRIAGPAVGAIQRIFAEDWNFSTDEDLFSERYFPDVAPAGDDVVQVVESGPDQTLNTARELIFAAIVAARNRLWISSPYFVPDAGVLDALRLAARMGVDVRVLLPERPDVWLPRYAGRYLWDNLMAEGVRIFLYRKGMMHAKGMIVDGRWAWAGSTNLDNRSLSLNFENLVVFHNERLIRDMEQAFVADLSESIEVDPAEFAKRRWPARLVENTARLFSPAL